MQVTIKPIASTVQAVVTSEKTIKKLTSLMSALPWNAFYF